MTNYSIGLSALRTSQYALDVVSNNIANADTPGFHRQNVFNEGLHPNYFGGFQIGSGVTINYIERVRNQVTESSLTYAISDVSRVDQILVVERQLESMFQPGEGSLNQRIDSFFAELTKLTSTPGEPTQRSAVIDQAQQMTHIFHQLNTQLFELKSAIGFQIDQEVGILNEKMVSLSELNGQISIQSHAGNPNQELDQRDALINEIAKVIDVSRHENFSSGSSLAFGGTSIQMGSTPVSFEMITLNDSQIGVAIADSTEPINLDGGRLPALLELYNSVIPEFVSRLDELAAGVMQQFDQVHATGTGTAGSFSLLEGTRSVADATVPLNVSGAAFPIEAGELFISVVDPSGNRRLESIIVDPETDSLEDVAAAISGIDNLQASVNKQTNRLQIIAARDYQFDFTGGTETTASLDNFSGTSAPSFSGSFNEGANSEFTYQISGSGEVGASEDLTVIVSNAEGAVVVDLDIGKGYEPGTELDVFRGVAISFSPGTVVANDSFVSKMVGRSDSMGILSSLGMNSFFEGNSSATIEVAHHILDDGGRFSAGKSNDIADTKNLFSMIELQKTRGMSNKTKSFGDYLNQVSTDIGVSVSTNTQLSYSLNSLQIRYEQDRDAVSGVDLNEELVQLQQFQKQYEAAVRVIQTAEAMLDELFSVIR